MYVGLCDAGRCQQRGCPRFGQRCHFFYRQWQSSLVKSEGVFVESAMCSMLACSFYNTCNVLKWDLMGFLTSYLFSGVLQKSHEVSLSLIGSHGSMTARVEVWEQYLNISEYDPRACVSAPCWVGSSSPGHPRHAYVTVV